MPSLNLNNRENESNSISTKLENLQQEYSKLLIKYEKSINEYSNYLNSIGLNSPDKFTFIKGYAFNGTGSAGNSDANTLQDCQASCANLSKCSGATFVSSKCLLRTGNSPIIPSSKNSYAIILKSQQLLLNMENINNQLISVNKQIMNTINNASPVLELQNTQRGIQQQNLLNNYSQLEEEREKINDLLKEYDDLNNENLNSSIITNKNYLTYLLLFLLVIGIIYIFIKVSYTNIVSETNIQYGGDLNNSSYFMVFFIILIIIFIKIYYIK